MTAPRILCVDTGKEWGGGTNSLLLLARGLVARGFAVELAFRHDYAGAGGSIADACRVAGLPFHRFSPGGGRWAKPLKELVRPLLFFRRAWRQAALASIHRQADTRPAAAALAALLRQGRFDLVYGNNQPASNQEVLLAAAASGVPAALHIRKTTMLRAGERDLANRVARRFVCVSDSLRQHYLRQGLDAARCVTIANGIDPAAVVFADRVAARAQLGLPAAAFVVGTVGSLLPLKSVGDLLAATARLAAGAGREAHCVVVGDGPERGRLEALADRLGLAGRCHFAGFRGDAATLLPAFDVFALPSSQEGMPRSILEAMLAALPVVAADVTGSRDLVVDGDTGRLYPHGQVDILAGLLRALADDTQLAARYGAAGRRRVLAEFSLEAHLDRVATLLREVLAEAGRGSQ